MAERAEIILSATDRTRAAFQSAKRNLDGLKTSAVGIAASFGPLLGTVGLLGSALSLVSLKGVIDGIDALNDLSDATGASRENLSALENVAERTGTSFDAVAASLLKFQKDLIDAKPGSDMAANLEAIGLSVEQLKSIDPAEAYRQAAIALNQYEEGGQRALQTQALFGRQTRETAAFLKDLAESGELVATVTTKQAEEAERFNKQLFEVQKNIKDVARAIASDMLPVLAELIGQLEDGRKAYGGFLTASLDIGLNVDPFKSLSENAAAATEQLGTYEKELAAVQQRQSEGGIAATLLANSDKQRVEFLGREITLLKQRKSYLDAQRVRAALAGGETYPDTREGLRAQAKPVAPPLANTSGAKAAASAAASAASKAAAEALSNLRKTTDGNVKAIGASLAAAQDEIRFGEQVSAQLYASGLESLDRYYAAQDKARQDNLAALRQAADDEIAQRQRLRDSPLLAGADRADDRQAVDNEIADVRTKLAAAEREASQAAQLAIGERQRAVQGLRDDVRALDAQIDDLGTGSAGTAAQLEDIAQRMAAARRLFFQAGASGDDADKKAAEYGRLLEVQLRFNEARRNYSTISNAAARAEESLAVAAQTNGDGMLETEAKLGAARRQSLAELDKLISTTRALVAISPQNTDLQDYLTDLEVQAQRVRAALDPTKLRLDAAADNIGDTIANGLERAAFEGGKLRDILRDIGTSVLYQVSQELVTKPAAAAIGNVIKGAGGQGTGANMLGQLGQLLGLIPGQQGTGGAAPAAAETAQATKNISALADAAGGSADVLGQLPQVAAIPATAALGELAGAAQIASAALAQIGGGSAASQTSGLLDGLMGLFGSGTAPTTPASIAEMYAGAGFDRGGYTGNAGASEPAGIVHGREFVFSAPAVSRIGVGALDTLHEAARHGREVSAAMLPGYAAGGYVGLRPATAAAAANSAMARPITLVQNFHGPADRRTVQQAAVDGMRTALASNARGAA